MIKIANFRRGDNFNPFGCLNAPFVQNISRLVILISNLVNALVCFPDLQLSREIFPLSKF